MASRTPGLLLVGHGTRSPAGVAQFRELLAAVRRRLPGTPVAGGFLELAHPPLAQAVADLVNAGCARIGVVPLVLVAGGHAKGDVPGSLARERERHPGVRFDYGRPLGTHPALLEILAERVDVLLGTAERSTTAVVFAARGTTDPDANAEVARAARLFEEGRGLAGVEVAFASLARPGVPAALERCRRLGYPRTIVATYFLFDGVLPARVAAQAAAGGVRATPVLGPQARVADLAVTRWREALAGEVRMSCDTCQYRIALPGFAHRVGAPQVPHAHPGDPDLASGVSNGHVHPHPGVPGHLS